jgi:5'-3' exoribonuclease 2
MRYYSNKFLVKTEQEYHDFTAKIRQAYIEGLQWVFSYYYKGCESWDWYYPYHYAPFACNLLNCDRVEVKFEQGEPRRPFEQLMSVFPKQSSHALPACYRWLMGDS